MNEEKEKIFEEIKSYLIFDEEEAMYVLKNDVPNEIIEKWNKYNEIDDDLIIDNNL